MVAEMDLIPIFAPANKLKGTLAEWLGTGLQNRLQQFESARYLQQKVVHVRATFSSIVDF
jgi:hypothetical protein